MQESLTIGVKLPRFVEEQGLRTDSFDPIAYIENSFLDTRKGALFEESFEEELVLPDFPVAEMLPEGDAPEKIAVPTGPDAARFRKTVMSAPRPRRTKRGTTETVLDADLSDTWHALPKNVAFLCSFFDDGVTKNYYRGEFKESREELIRRLLDPELSLEETARLLGVCPATVRRYTNRKWLAHHRTTGGQRRFRLSNIVRFVDEHGRLPED